MDDLPRLVAEVLRDTGLAPERLELEITEGVLIEESAHTLAVLRALKRQGVRIVLDDFGTGYSSLSYLRRFPFDKLKIDQSFMKGLGEDGESDAIVRAILALAHDIVLTVGFLSVTRIEVSTQSIAAILTVIGYSMNEKVISFDRLRENLRKYKTTPLAEVINLSENERLSRTIITGTTALLALSGSVLNPASALFSLTATMAFGILVGTYSSIYVALPVILLWGVKRDDEEASAINFQTARR